jgi:hypothetical protein
MSTHSDSNPKGILVSNRPDSVLHTTHYEVPANLYQPFLPSGKAIPQENFLGLPPAREGSEANLYAKMRLADKRKEQQESNVHVRHKKWLKDLQHDVQDQRYSDMEVAIAKEERKQKFLDTQSKLRKALMSVEAPGRILQTAVSQNDSSATLTQTLNQVVKEQQKEQKKVDEEQKKKTSLLKQRPKWAMSEKEAEEVMDLEADDLIDFANSLNFSDIIDDIEVREALNVIHSKVKKKTEEDSESTIEDNTTELGNTTGGISVPFESKDSDSVSIVSYRSNNGGTAEAPATPRVKSKTAVHDKEWDNSIKTNDKKDETTVSSVPTTLKNIHSKASIANLVDSVRSNTAEQQEKRMQELIRDIHTLNEENIKRNSFAPQIITHDKYHIGLPKVKTINGTEESLNPHEQNRVLLKLKKDPNYVQTLPYLYRCPSI